MVAQDVRRAALVDAATEWVLAYGLTRLSLRPLAKALGTSDRMLVYYFGSKDALVDAVIVRANEQLATIVAAESPADAQPDAAAALGAMWARVSAPECAPYLRLYFEVYALAMQQPERYRPHLLAIHRAWLDVVAARIDPGAPSSEAAQRTGTIAVALVEGLLLDLLVTEDRPRVDMAAHEALAVLLRPG